MKPEILKRARDLRRLAERAGTPAEARTAAHLLTKFMSRHRLAEIDLEDEEDSPTYSDKPIYRAARVTGWRTNLAVGLGRLYGVVVVRQRTLERIPNAPMRFGYALRLCGTPEDCERVRRLYRWLSDDVMRLGREWARSSNRATVDSWRLGFVNGLIESAKEAAAEAVADATCADATSAALVRVVDARWERSLAYLREHVDSLDDRRSPPGASRVAADAFAAGKAEGRQRHPSERIDG